VGIARTRHTPDRSKIPLPCDDGRQEVFCPIHRRIGTITVKLVIFDFDGTLVDSRKTDHRIKSRRFGQFGFALPSEDESLSLVGMSLELVLLAIGWTGRAGLRRWLRLIDMLLPLLRADAAYAEVPFGVCGRLADRAGRAQ